MLLTYQRDRFEAMDSYKERDLLSKAEFRWDASNMVWWTKDVIRAKQFMHAADEHALLNIYRLEAEDKAAIAQSWAAEAEDVKLLAPKGKEYAGYQRACVRYWLSRKHRRVLIADEQGLGKTIETIGGINEIARRENRRTLQVLVVCPAHLTRNWLYEMRIWLMLEAGIDIATSNHFPDCSVVIINYENLGLWSDEIRARKWDVFVDDECHYLRNSRTFRAQEVYGSEKDEYPAIQARWVAFLTGTPMVNRPRELYPIIHYLDPGLYPNYVAYGREYCAGKKSKKTGRWNFNGASNLDDLNAKLRSSIMIRRLKNDVMKELPPKRRQIIEMPIDVASEDAKEAIAEELKAWKAHDAKIKEFRKAVKEAKDSSDEKEYKSRLRALRDTVRVSFKEMSAFRKRTAVAKVPAVIQHIEDIFEQNPEGYKLVVFAHHHEVTDRILEHFGEIAVDMTGNVSPEQRFEQSQVFQNNPLAKLAVAGILAAGTGLTLTASHHVIFAELDWVPGNLSQAEDRVHRKGQLDGVLVQHLVLEGSLDARMSRKVVGKQDVIDKAMNEQVMEREEKQQFKVEKTEPAKGAAPAGGTPTTTDPDSARHMGPEPEDLGPKMTPLGQETPPPPAYDSNDPLVYGIHLGMRMLSNMCDGAKAVDGVGFSKLDAGFGHSVAGQSSLSFKQARYAARLCTKYRRQLSPEIVAAAKQFLQKYRVKKGAERSTGQK